jgi:hypothetical protein
MMVQVLRSCVLDRKEILCKANGADRCSYGSKRENGHQKNPNGARAGGSVLTEHERYCCIGWLFQQGA